jgi:hypothetical protein
MNALSGYVEIEMGGEILPFKFGTNCWALFCEMHHIEFGQIAESGIFSSNFLALRDLYYSAHVTALRSKGETAKINLERFSDLLDETKGANEKLQEAMLTSKIMGYTFTELAERGKESKKK